MQQIIVMIVVLLLIILIDNRLSLDMIRCSHGIIVSSSDIFMVLITFTEACSNTLSIIGTSILIELLLALHSYSSIFA